MRIPDGHAPDFDRRGCKALRKQVARHTASGRPWRRSGTRRWQRWSGMHPAALSVMHVSRMSSAQTGAVSPVLVVWADRRSLVAALAAFELEVSIHWRLLGGRFVCDANISLIARVTSVCCAGGTLRSRRRRSPSLRVPGRWKRSARACSRRLRRWPPIKSKVPLTTADAAAHLLRFVSTCMRRTPGPDQALPRERQGDVKHGQRTSMLKHWCRLAGARLGKQVVVSERRLAALREAYAAGQAALAAAADRVEMASNTLGQSREDGAAAAAANQLARSVGTTSLYDVRPCPQQWLLVTQSRAGLAGGASPAQHRR